MRTLLTSNYGVYNSEWLTKLLEKNKPKKSSITGNQINEEVLCDQKLVPITITQTGDLTVVSKGSAVQTGCSPNNAGAGDLCFDGSGDALCYPSLLFTDAQDPITQEEIEGETFNLAEPITLYVSQDQSNPLIEITLNSQHLATINTLEAGSTACNI